MAGRIPCHKRKGPVKGPFPMPVAAGFARSVAFVAATVALAVAVAAMFMVMMVALRIRVIGQVPIQQCLHLRIRIARRAGIKLNAGFCQRHTRAAADAAADQDIYTVLAQKAGQCAMAAACRIHNLRGNDPAILHRIQLELLAVAEMLEHLTILIGNRNFHVKNLVLSGFIFYRFGIITDARRLLQPKHFPAHFS